MSRQSRHAFTLVELLVVIGIIALLISILLPALQKARESAVRVMCLSNMNQTYTALNAYAADNKGWYPPGTTDHWRYVSPNPPTETLPEWTRGLPNYSGFAKPDGWGNWYGRRMWEVRGHVHQIFPPDLARYLGGDPTVMGSHYKVTACAAIQRNNPEYNPIEYGYWYGMPGYDSIDPAPRQGSVKREDMASAGFGANGIVIRPGTVPVKFLFSCSDLRGSSGGIPVYWGFRGTQGGLGTPRGEVHGTGSATGKFMNVMTLDGGTILVRNTPGWAATGDVE